MDFQENSLNSKHWTNGGFNSYKAFMIDYIESFPKARVLCLGDIMVDHFIYGTVSAISEEAPVPVLRSQSKYSALGGVGNVFRTLAHLGTQCKLISVVGNDDGFKQLQKLLEQLPNSPYVNLIKDDSRRTTQVTRNICGQMNRTKHHLLRLDEYDTHDLSSELENIVIESVRQLMPSIDVIIFSDYGKGILTNNVFIKLLYEAKSHGIKTLVDPIIGQLSTKYNGAYIFKPNRYELSSATFLPTETESEIILASKKLRETYLTDVQYILTTRDAHGMMLCDSVGGVFHEPSHANKIVDDVGAGDTVIALLAIGLSLNIPLQEAMYLASVAAGIVIAKPGTATLTCEELKLRVAPNLQSSLMPTVGNNKIVRLSEAKQVISQWKEQGLRIGFTNGCFDLLHIGHMYSIQKGKLYCDKLIVAVNSDASVQRLKGLQRPIQNENIRMKALSALDEVDLVILVDEDTPTRLLEQLKPCVLFKGLPKEDIVGASLVEEEYGGQVISIPLLPEFSTTIILNHIESSRK